MKIKRTNSSTDCQLFLDSFGCGYRRIRDEIQAFVRILTEAFDPAVSPVYEPEASHDFRCATAAGVGVK